MDIARILSLGMKTLTTITSFAQSGKDITKVIEAGKNVFSKDASQITDADLDEAERVLDEALDEFEKPLTRKA